MELKEALLIFFVYVAFAVLMGVLLVCCNGGC